MRQDSSYGIIPLVCDQGKWSVLLVRHRAGHWSFPKGHPEKGESHHETAARELQEETGLLIERMLSTNPFIETYTFSVSGERIVKTVYYYPALVSGSVVIQVKEISDYRWLSLSEAKDLITFSEGKKLCLQVQQLIDLFQS